MAKKVSQMTNKPIQVNIPTSTFKRSVGDLPTLKKKPRASPSSLSSDVTELSLLKREQMDKNDAIWSGTTKS